MASRPKRQAAIKAPAIVEISDSDDEGLEISPTKKSRPATNARIDRAAKSLADQAAPKTKTQRWPSKEKRAAQKDVSSAVDGQCSSRSTKGKNKIADKSLSPKEKKSKGKDVLPSSTDHEEPSCSQASGGNYMNASAENPNESLPKTTGRSSFWARRKVWNIHELLAETENIETGAARNIVQLFENENTIPFICRYRRDLVDHITPERLRDIKNSYTEIVGLRKKAETIVTQLEKENIVNEDIRTEMLCAKSNEELEFLYAPYKPASKGSLAERAKALGLEIYADRLLYGEGPQVRLESIVDRRKEDLDSVEKVAIGICNIMSHNISKHTGVLEELRRLQKVHRIVLKSTKTKLSAAAAKENKSKAVGGTSAAHKNKSNKTDESKFEHYFDFQNDVRYLKPHQVLAINRGEKLKFLSVKIIIADYVKNDIKRYIYGIFMNEGMRYELRQQLFERAFEECYSKKLQPLLSRQIRSDLNEIAKKAAIDVFAKNLKQLLLVSPLKGERILGIDPGFTNGCKLALISETADVLATGVIYPHTRRSNDVDDEHGERVAKMLAKHNCKIIALGNGTACRETEFWLSKMMSMGILDSATVRYSIVSEQGASIYSCSEVARQEFPTMDMNEISAVSIARRLNDPLSEYVKIEPRHIGVGMYQHDVNEKTLSESLNEVVSECVSFVGVDINTASLSVLKHIAGLSAKKAEKIIQHRLDNGPFRTRKDLLQVKSIGEKTFVQCAGFVRIEPRSVGGTIDNLLDCTWVHPESYVMAKKIISKCGLHLKEIGCEDFITKIKEYAKREGTIDDLAKEFKVPKERVEIVFVGLQRELFQDYRSDFDKRPLFKQGITRITELEEGDLVTGAVTNLTHFGAFVDIGVECDGLIHASKMNNIALGIADRITASIISVDVKRKRIGLRLEEMIHDTETSMEYSFLLR